MENCSVGPFRFAKPTCDHERVLFRKRTTGSYFAQTRIKRGGHIIAEGLVYVLQKTRVYTRLYLLNQYAVKFHQHRPQIAIIFVSLQVHRQDMESRETRLGDKAAAAAKAAIIGRQGQQRRLRSCRETRLGDKAAAAAKAAIIGRQGQQRRLRSCRETRLGDKAGRQGRSGSEGGDHRETRPAAKAAIMQGDKARRQGWETRPQRQRRRRS